MVRLVAVVLLLLASPALALTPAERLAQGVVRCKAALDAERAEAESLRLKLRDVDDIHEAYVDRLLETHTAALNAERHKTQAWRKAAQSCQAVAREPDPLWRNPWVVGGAALIGGFVLGLKAQQWTRALRGE